MVSMGSGSILLGPLLILRMFDFFLFIEILLHSHHFSTFCITDFVSFVLHTTAKSSAKKNGLHVSVYSYSHRSFMNKLKRSGERMDPCGTPRLVCWSLILLLFRIRLIVPIISSSHYASLILRSRSDLFTESNAYFKSKNIISVVPEQF